MQRICDVCMEVRLQKRKEYQENTEWNKLRRLVFRRDGDICKICGTQERLIIHHWDKNRKNNTFSNLITFCERCHILIHRRVYKEYG